MNTENKDVDNADCEYYWYKPGFRNTIELVLSSNDVIILKKIELLIDSILLDKSLHGLDMKKLPDENSVKSIE